MGTAALMAITTCTVRPFHCLSTHIKGTRSTPILHSTMPKGCWIVAPEFVFPNPGLPSPMPISVHSERRGVSPAEPSSSSGSQSQELGDPVARLPRQLRALFRRTRPPVPRPRQQPCAAPSPSHPPCAQRCRDSDRTKRHHGLATAPKPRLHHLPLTPNLQSPATSKETPHDTMRKI
uniref:Uncharacterized protein n=1 Tax=Arundo donax TaxID=35708 RepID=A0A0A9CZX4_ARUDO